MAPRVPNKELTGFTGSMMKRMTRRMMGRVPEPLGVMWNNPKVLKGTMAASRKMKRWDEVDQETVVSVLATDAAL